MVQHSTFYWFPLFSIENELLYAEQPLQSLSYIDFNLLISPLFPAIGSEEATKKKQATDNEEPENLVNKSMSPIKDIGDSVDTCAIG